MDENNQIQMTFLEVCSFGDLEKVKSMLDDGKIDPNFHHHSNGWTALHWAARRDHQKVVELLLQAGFSAESTAKDGKTPIDLAVSSTVKEIFMNNKSDKYETVSQSPEMEKRIVMKENHFENENGQENEQLRNNKNSLSKTKQLAKSFDSAFNDWNMGNNRTTSTKHEVYSYGRRDSLNRTRFLLVRTSSGRGKETFKRVTFPGHGTIDTLKQTLEKALRKGKVLQMLLLPDKVKIETEQQVRDLANCQKLEVIFGANTETRNDRKLSLDESKLAHSKQELTMDKKAADKFIKHFTDSISRDCESEDIRTLSDDSIPITTTVSEITPRINNSDTLPNDPSLREEIPETTVTSECLLAAETPISSIEISLPSKATVVEMITISDSQENSELNENNSAKTQEHDTKEVHELSESESDLKVSSVRPVPNCMDDFSKLNNIIVMQLDKDNKLFDEEDWDKNIFKKISHERKLKLALIIGGIVGFGSLAYIVFKK